MRRDNTISFSSSAGFQCLLNYSLILTHRDTPEISCCSGMNSPRVCTGQCQVYTESGNEQQKSTVRSCAILWNPSLTNITSGKGTLTFQSRAAAMFAKGTNWRILQEKKSQETEIIGSDMHSQFSLWWCRCIIPWMFTENQKPWL